MGFLIFAKSDNLATTSNAFPNPTLLLLNNLLPDRCIVLAVFVSEVNDTEDKSYGGVKDYDGEILEVEVEVDQLDKECPNGRDGQFDLDNAVMQPELQNQEGRRRMSWNIGGGCIGDIHVAWG